MQNNASPQRGFTLIELLVALMIFAVLSGLSYRSLSALIQTRERVNAETRHWRELMLFFNRLDMDVHQHIPRSVQKGNIILPSWQAHPELSSADDAQLMFTRLGSWEAEGNLRDSQRIGYRLKNQTIELLIWPALDTLPDEKPTVLPLLNGVKKMQIRYLTQDKSRWVSNWPLTSSEKNMAPKAMEIMITLISGDQLSRVYSL